MCVVSQNPLNWVTFLSCLQQETVCVYVYQKMDAFFSEWFGESYFKTQTKIEPRNRNFQGFGSVYLEV